MGQKNRGAQLAQIREKNSSSAMAQLQDGNHKNDIESAMEQDMLIEAMTYLQNHQS